MWDGPFSSSPWVEPWSLSNILAVLLENGFRGDGGGIYMYEGGKKRRDRARAGHVHADRPERVSERSLELTRQQKALETVNEMGYQSSPS